MYCHYRENYSLFHSVSGEISSEPNVFCLHIMLKRNKQILLIKKTVYLDSDTSSRVNRNCICANWAYTENT